MHDGKLRKAMRRNEEGKRKTEKRTGWWKRCERHTAGDGRGGSGNGASGVYVLWFVSVWQRLVYTARKDDNDCLAQLRDWQAPPLCR